MVSMRDALMSGFFAAYYRYTRFLNRVCADHGTIDGRAIQSIAFCVYAAG